MSSLSLRLKELQVPGETAKFDFSHLSLSQLEETKVDFGQAHLGRTYREMWLNHQEWLLWFAGRYEKSGKESHQKILHYVQLMVERAELAGTRIPVHKGGAIECDSHEAESQGLAQEAGSAAERCDFGVGCRRDGGVRSVWRRDRGRDERGSSLRGSQFECGSPGDPNAVHGECTVSDSPDAGNHPASIRAPVDQCPSWAQSLHAGDPTGTKIMLAMLHMRPTVKEECSTSWLTKFPMNLIKSFMRASC